MRVIVCSCLALLISTSAWAESVIDVSAVQQLNKLEKKYFSHTFESDDAELRAGRLEKLILGEENTTASLKERIEKLAALSPKDNSESAESANARLDTEDNSAKTNENELAPARDDEGKVRLQSDYPHVTFLEKNILGKTYAGEALPGRLSRLELAAFGNASGNPDFSQRTEALDRYVDKRTARKTNSKELVQAENRAYSNAETSRPGSSSAMSKQVLTTVANTVLGMTGFGMIPAAMGMAQRMKEPAAQQYSEQEDDPLVLAATPPSSETRLLTKVAWCEMKVFGRTFSSVHLTDRLKQLSQQLQFETTKSGLELMDDISGMIKVVQSNYVNSDKKPIGSTSQPSME